MDTCSTGSSTGSNFRELDVEFLQTQAKIWLEQVLDKRFDEEDTVVDILADGELMFQVSMLISELMQRKFGGEPESPVPLPEIPVFEKHSGKYLPYSNVDAFLKVCQKLGLTGVDLFSPPDVVEKKDIRRVCLCIRALSKKARSKHLNVPDFDLVTHTVAMPTGMVGGIRKYLEQARYSSSSDSGHVSSPDSRERLAKSIEPICTSPFELSPEMSDEAESKLRSPAVESPGSIGAEITEVTKFTLSASPSRSPHFAGQNWSSLGMTAGASPVEPYSPSKDKDANECDESEVIDTVMTDVVNGYLVKSKPFICDECFVNGIHAELINTSAVSASLPHSADQGGAASAGIGCTPADLSSMTNSITQIHDLSIPVQSDTPSKDRDNESFSDESRFTDRVMTDAVHGCSVNSKPSNSNVHFASNTHEELIHMAAVPVSMFHFAEEEANDANVDSIHVLKEDSYGVNCASARKAESLSIDFQNTPETDRGDMDCANALKADSVSVDTAHGVDIGCASLPKADNLEDYANVDSVDVDSVDVLKGDGVDSYCTSELKATVVDVDHVNLPKADSVDIDRLNALKADSVDSDCQYALKAGNVGIDCRNVPKANSDDADPTNMLKAYSVAFDCKNVMRSDCVDVECANVPKPDRGDIDCTYVLKADSVDIGCTSVPKADSVDIDGANILIEDSVNTLCADVPKADNVDIDCDNMLKEDCVVEPANVPKADSVDTDGANVLIEGSVNALCADVPKADNVDIDCENMLKEDCVVEPANVPKADSVDTGGAHILIEDSVNALCADVPKAYNVDIDIDCENMLKENCVVEPTNAVKADSVDLDIAVNMQKADVVDVDRVDSAENVQKADSKKLGWEDVRKADTAEVEQAGVPAADTVEVDWESGSMKDVHTNVPKEDSVDISVGIDYRHMPCLKQHLSSVLNFVGFDHTLIASESIKKHIGSGTDSADASCALIATETVDQLFSLKSGSEDVDHAESLTERETVVTEKDKSARKSTPGKHHRSKLWTFFTGGLVLLGTTLAVLRARKPAVYVIKEGDTISQISRRVGKSSWKELVQINPEIKNPDLIYPGDRLRLQ